MRTILIRLLSLSVAAAMFFTLNACSGGVDPSESTTAEQVIAADATVTQEEEPMDLTAPAAPTSGTQEQSTDVPTSSPVDSKALAVETYNRAANDVKASRPAMHKERATEFKGLSQENETLENMIKKLNVLPPPENYSYQAGTNYNDKFPALNQSWSSKLTLQDVQSITCTDNGNDYIIDMTLPTDFIATSVSDYSTTTVGKAMGVNSGTELQKGVEGIGTLTGWDQTYYDCTIHAVVDKTTGKLKETTHVLNFQLTLKGKVGINLPANGVTVTLRITEHYAFS